MSEVAGSVPPAPVQQQRELGRPQLGQVPQSLLVAALVPAGPGQGQEGEPLRQAVAARQVTVLTSPPATAEWQRVLSYPILKLDPTRQSELFASYVAAATPATRRRRADRLTGRP